MIYEQHLQKAQQCDECLEYLLKSGRHWAWIAVVAAYSALHRVDAIIAIIPSCPFNPTSHASRERALSSHPDLRRDLLQDYGVLKSNGSLARYEAVAFDRGKVELVVLPRLRKIESYQSQITQRYSS